MARFNSETPSGVPLDSTKRQYGIYMHNLLQDPDGSTPQLVAQGTNWNAAYEAMRIHAGNQISANPKWGATRELTTQNFYEILDTRNHVRLRYVVDAIYPTDVDQDGTVIWKRLGEFPAPRIHYGMYVDLHCDDRDRAQNFFVGGFRSLGEATFSMKQSAGGALMGEHKGKGAELCASQLAVVDKKGRVLQRYSVQKGSLNENGAFVRNEEWDVDWQAALNGKQVAADRQPSAVLSIGSHVATNPPPLPQPAQQFKPHPKPQVLATATPKPQPGRTTRRQSQQPTPEPAPAVEAVSKAQLPPAKSTRCQSKLAASSAAEIEEGNDEVIAEAEPAAEPVPEPKTEADDPWCTCRLPDDGSFMIECDNDACPIQWYHDRCVNIHQALPEGALWYCDMCKREGENKKGKGKAKAPARSGPKKGGGGGGGVKPKAKGKAKGKK
jgi:hypothetical protein